MNDGRLPTGGRQFSMRKHTISMEGLAPSASPERNFDMHIDQDRRTLVIRVHLDGGGGRATRSGYNISIATTKGNRLLKGTNIRVGLNVYHEACIDASAPPALTEQRDELDTPSSFDEDDGVHPDHRPPPQAAPPIGPPPTKDEIYRAMYQRKVRTRRERRLAERAKSDECTDYSDDAPAP